MYNYVKINALSTVFLHFLSFFFQLKKVTALDENTRAPT